MRALLLAMLIVHTGATLYTLKDDGVWSVFPPFRDLFVYQIFSDLVMSLGIVFILCYAQLKKKGRSLRGLLLAMAGTAAFGSFAPMLYLLIEKDLFES